MQSSNGASVAYTPSNLSLLQALNSLNTSTNSQTSFEQSAILAGINNEATYSRSLSACSTEGSLPIQYASFSNLGTDTNYNHYLTAISATVATPFVFPWPSIIQPCLSASIQSLSQCPPTPAISEYQYNVLRTQYDYPSSNSNTVNIYASAVKKSSPTQCSSLAMSSIQPQIIIAANELPPMGPDGENEKAKIPENHTLSKLPQTPNECTTPETNQSLSTALQQFSINTSENSSDQVDNLENHEPRDIGENGEAENQSAEREKTVTSNSTGTGAPPSYISFTAQSPVPQESLNDIALTTSLISSSEKEFGSDMVVEDQLKDISLEVDQIVRETLTALEQTEVDSYRHILLPEYTKKQPKKSKRALQHSTHTTRKKRRGTGPEHPDMSSSLTQVKSNFDSSSHNPTEGRGPSSTGTSSIALEDFGIAEEENSLDGEFKYTSGDNGYTSSSEDKERRSKLPLRSILLLRAFFSENVHYPYPTDEQKIQLANESNLTVKQISNWFTNTRRRFWQPYMKKVQRAAQSVSPSSRSTPSVTTRSRRALTAPCSKRNVEN